MHEDDPSLSHFDDEEVERFLLQMEQMISFYSSLRTISRRRGRKGGTKQDDSDLWRDVEEMNESISKRQRQKSNPRLQRSFSRTSEN
jgi:hypothetical protein